MKGDTRRRLRLGLLGTGVAARQLYLPAFARLSRRIEVVACASRHRVNAETYARLAGIPTVAGSAAELLALPELDAVLISLPIDRQPHWVLRALAAGKAVLSEKPVAPSPASGRRLVAAAARLPRPWLVGENYAFLPEVGRLQRWLERGRLGGLRLVEVRQIVRMDRRNPYFNTAWRTRPRHVGGFVVDGGVHLAHVVRRLLGMPVEMGSMTAGFDPALPPIDTAVATMRFASGVLGTWASCFSAFDRGAPLLRVLGSEGSAELHSDRAVLRTAGGREVEYRSGADSYEAQLAHFADVVLRGAPPAVAPADALADLELIAAICAGGRGARQRKSPGKQRSSRKAGRTS
jgi:predicted dehydrogenase